MEIKVSHSTNYGQLVSNNPIQRVLSSENLNTSGHLNSRIKNGNLTCVCVPYYEGGTSVRAHFLRPEESPSSEGSSV